VSPTKAMAESLPGVSRTRDLALLRANIRIVGRCKRWMRAGGCWPRVQPLALSRRVDVGLVAIASSCSSFPRGNGASRCDEDKMRFILLASVLAAAAMCDIRRSHLRHVPVKWHRERARQERLRFVSTADTTPASETACGSATVPATGCRANS